MKELVEYIAKRLVDRPEEVWVHVVAGENATVCEVKVGDGEIGKIIGKHGRTIDAIRAILAGVAAREDKRVVLELLE